MVDATLVDTLAEVVDATLVDTLVEVVDATLVETLAERIWVVKSTKKLQLQPGVLERTRNRAMKNKLGNNNIIS